MDESSSDHKGKKKKERYKFIYGKKGYHHEYYCMRKNVYEMEKML